MTRTVETSLEVGSRPSYRKYWHALYRRDVARAEQIVDLARAAWKPGRVYLRLFQPALGLSGKLWAAGAITYHDEHFVTHHTQRLMRRVRRDWIPAETTGPLALAAGAGQESHLIGLRMVCDFLRAENWRVHWLPSNDRGVLRRTVAAVRPDAFLLSIGLDRALAQARRMIQELRETRFRGLVVVGGAAVNRDPASRVKALDADLTARNGRHLVRLLRGKVRPRHAR
jgi:methanogenic corrinoid protein MtbC1